MDLKIIFNHLNTQQKIVYTTNLFLIQSINDSIEIFMNVSGINGDDLI